MRPMHGHVEANAETVPWPGYAGEVGMQISRRQVERADLTRRQVTMRRCQADAWIGIPGYQG